MIMRRLFLLVIGIIVLVGVDAKSIAFQTFGQARGQITKSLESNSLAITLSANGNVYPELLSWSSALSCVRTQMHTQSVFHSLTSTLLPLQTKYICHLSHEYAFISCPELVKADERFPRFVLNTDGKIIRSSARFEKQYSEAIGASKAFVQTELNQQCDNVVEFEFISMDMDSSLPKTEYIIDKSGHILQVQASAMLIPGVPRELHVPISSFLAGVLGSFTLYMYFYQFKLFKKLLRFGKKLTKRSLLYAIRSARVGYKIARKMFRAGLRLALRLLKGYFGEPIQHEKETSGKRIRSRSRSRATSKGRNKQEKRKWFNLSLPKMSWLYLDLENMLENDSGSDSSDDPAAFQFVELDEDTYIAEGENLPYLAGKNKHRPRGRSRSVKE